MLIRHILRLVPLGHLLAGAMIAAAAVVLNEPTAPDPLPEMVDALRLAMVPLVVGVAFTLDDPVDRWLATPVPLAARRWVRLGITAVGLIVLWGGVLGVAEAFVGIPDGLPTATLTGELATLTAVTLAAAATAGRSLADRVGGIVAAPTALLVATVQLLLPARWALFVAYHRPPRTGEPPAAEWLDWVVAHQRWAFVAAAAVVVLAVSSRDPDRRSLRQLVNAAPAPSTREPASQSDSSGY